MPHKSFNLLSLFLLQTSSPLFRLRSVIKGTKEETTTVVDFLGSHLMAMYVLACAIHSKSLIAGHRE